MKPTRPARFTAAVYRYDQATIYLADARREVGAALAEWGEAESQAVIAAELKLSPSFVNDVIRGRRQWARKAEKA